MSRVLVYQCDWRGCNARAQSTPEAGMPPSWAEFQITLMASGPMVEGWRDAADTTNTRSVCVCPQHVRHLLAGALGGQPEDEAEPARKLTR